MNLQSLIVVVLRLMALNFLLRAAMYLTPTLFQFLRFYDTDPRFMVVPWLMLIGFTLAAALLGFCALPIARFVTRGISVELSFGAMSLVDCYTIVFMSVGLFYIMGYLPQVLNWAHYFFKTAASGFGDSQSQFKLYDVSQAFIPFIAGILLFVYGRQWAVSLARRQTDSIIKSSVNEQT